MGSGFYSSSIMGMLTFFGVPIPHGLGAILADMRRLRQRIDEIADLYEDAMTGLISYPVARLLCLDMQGATGKIVVDSWNRTRNLVVGMEHDAGRLNEKILGDSILRSCYDVLHRRLIESGVLSECYQEAADLWSSIAGRIEGELGGQFSSALLPVIDLKRCLLER